MPIKELESPLIHIGKGVEGAIRGYIEGQDRQQRRQELAAKLEAQKTMKSLKIAEFAYEYGIEIPPEAASDSGLLMRGLVSGTFPKKKGFISKADLNRQVKESQIAANYAKPEAQEQKLIRDNAKIGKIPVLDEHGFPMRDQSGRIMWTMDKDYVETQEKERQLLDEKIKAQKALTKQRLRPRAGKAGASGKIMPSSATKPFRETLSGYRDIVDLSASVKKYADQIGPYKGKLANLPKWMNIGNVLDKPFQAKAELDRVKQVIGKAIEGGVLRKEDEEKYMKILPTTDDSIAVVESKIEQISKMLKRDLRIFVDTQGAAGYDVHGLRNLMNTETTGSGKKKSGKPWENY